MDGLMIPIIMRACVFAACFAMPPPPASALLFAAALGRPRRRGLIVTTGLTDLPH
jgi:threonine/homoserine/homoserine lactone efflux protein